jgi:hypothetical protein
VVRNKKLNIFRTQYILTFRDDGEGQEYRSELVGNILSFIRKKSISVCENTLTMFISVLLTMH